MKKVKCKYCGKKFAIDEDSPSFRLTHFVDVNGKWAGHIGCALAVGIRRGLEKGGKGDGQHN